MWCGGAARALSRTVDPHRRGHAVSSTAWNVAMCRALATVLVAGASSASCGTPVREVASAATTATPPNGVAMFRGSPGHLGVYETRPVTIYGGLQWRFQSDGPIQTTPVVVGDLVLTGSQDGRLYALDRESAQLRWTFDAKSAIASSPAVAEGLVLFATRDRHFLAIDARNGAERWRMALGADVPWPWGYESGDFFLSSPVYSRGFVLFGGGDGKLYSVRAADGRVRWQLPTGGRVRSSPAVDGDLVFVGSADGKMYAAELETGKLRWTYDTEGVRLKSADFGYDRRTIQSSPAVANGVVVFGARDGFLYAVDRDRGTPRWRFDHKISWVNSSPAVSQGLVFAGSSDGQFVQAVDLETGAEKWRVKTASLVWASPAVAGDLVYFADWVGFIYALDARTGAERWRTRMGGRVLGGLVVDGGRLYYGSDDGALYAINSAPATLQRAVFWDSSYVQLSNVGAHELITRYFRNRRYDVVDAKALAAFLQARIADRAPSVVVFALDCLPDAAASQASDTTLFRRYLSAGGKVVWLGMPPLLWPNDPKTGARSITSFDRSAGTHLLGVDHTPANFDPRASSVTEAGKRWGLSGWWMANWAANPHDVSEVLAVNDEGFATAWVKSYGGGKGTGFVRIPIGTLGENLSPAQLQMLLTAAEYLPR
jgi:eukaryotic-like serine/threonine-protein kinase